MNKNFQDSKTKQNLMRAFAGESMARNRYQFAAAAAKSSDLYVIQAVFDFTADQEKEHGEIFYNHLKQELGTQTLHVPVDIEAGYPVDLKADIVSLLRSAYDHEYEEYGDAYPSFGKTAQEEGFPKIADSFNRIAEIEKVHGDRFQLFADMLEQNKLFVSDVETGWMCLNCGHVLTGKQSPLTCPVCSHSQGYFIRLELAPYQK